MRVNIKDVEANKDQDSENEEIDDEFTEEELMSIYPARDLLHRIHFDHIYTTSGNGAGTSNDSRKGEYVSKSVTYTPNKVDVLLSNKVHEKQTNSIVYTLVHSPSVQTIKTKPANLISNSFNSRTRVRSNESDMKSLNAESIQQVFQNMINLTSLKPMSEPDQENGTAFTPKINRIKIVDTLPDSTTPTLPSDVSTKKDSLTGENESIEEQKLKPKITTEKKPEVTKIKKTYKKVHSKNRKNKRETTDDLNSNNQKDDAKAVHKSKSGSSARTDVSTKTKKRNKKEINCDTDEIQNKCKEVDSEEWKATVAEHEMNTLLRVAANLLVQRWGEYLTMNAEKINKFEVESAREVGMIEEVVEMLEDKDRYVWQLVDELRFI